MDVPQEQAAGFVGRLVARWVPPMTFESAVLIDWPEAGERVAGTGKRSGRVEIDVEALRGAYAFYLRDGRRCQRLRPA